MDNTLVLAPGLLCDGATWAAQVKAFENKFQIQIADYGLLDSLTRMAESILAKAPARFALAGHSMGGRVALEVMRLAPERVTRLALLDTGCKSLPHGEAGEMERAGRFALLDSARRQGMRMMATRWVQNMVHPSRLQDAALIGPIVEMFARKTPEIYAAQIQALLNRQDASAALRNVRCPALVLCGADDAWSTLTQHEEISRAIAGSRLVSVAVCGHMSMMERPLEVNSAFAEWLA